MSMTFAREVMQMELNPEHKHFLKVMAAKQSVMASVFTATARVRDGLLRPAGDDGLDDLLARVKKTAKGAEAPRLDDGNGTVLTLEDLFN